MANSVPVSAPALLSWMNISGLTAEFDGYMCMPGSGLIRNDPGLIRNSNT